MTFAATFKEASMICYSSKILLNFLWRSWRTFLQFVVLNTALLIQFEQRCDMFVVDCLYRKTAGMNTNAKISICSGHRHWNTMFIFQSHVCKIITGQ